MTALRISACSRQQQPSLVRARPGITHLGRYLIARCEPVKAKNVPGVGGEVPNEENQDEESEAHARPIQPDDTGFGPRGFLLAGFSQEDSEKAKAWMQEMEPGFLVSHTVDETMSMTLGEALFHPDTQEMNVHEWAQSRTLCPRICIMSGLTGEEQIAIAESWGDYAGSNTPFFAAAVPNSLNEPIKTILQSIVDENAKLEEDDPRLNPSNFLNGVDMKQLRAQISQKLKQKEEQDRRAAFKKEKKRQEAEAAGARPKGFG